MNTASKRIEPMRDRNTLVARLRDYAKSWSERAGSKDIVDEAADEIERLSNSQSHTRAALEAIQVEVARGKRGLATAAVHRIGEIVRAALNPDGGKS